MKNYLKVDIANARLVMDRTFAKNCAIAGSAEYNLLQATRKDYPNFTVEQRTMQHLSKVTIKGHKVFLTQIFDSAVEDELIAKNPVRSQRLTNPGK